MAEYVLDALYNALYNWMHISCWMLEREALQSHILQFKMSASVKKKVQAYVQLEIWGNCCCCLPDWETHLLCQFCQSVS